MVIVIAENRDQCKRWCDSYAINPKQVMYISDPDQLRGLRLDNEAVAFVGDFWRRKNYQQIREVGMMQRGRFPAL